MHNFLHNAIQRKMAICIFVYWLFTQNQQYSTLYLPYMTWSANFFFMNSTVLYHPLYLQTNNPLQFSESSENCQYVILQHNQNRIFLMHNQWYSLLYICIHELIWEIFFHALNHTTPPLMLVNKWPPAVFWIKWKLEICKFVPPKYGLFMHNQQYLYPIFPYMTLAGNLLFQCLQPHITTIYACKQMSPYDILNQVKISVRKLLHNIEVFYPSQLYSYLVSPMHNVVCEFVFPWTQPHITIPYAHVYTLRMFHFLLV